MGRCKSSVDNNSCHRLEAYLDLRLAHCVYNAWWRIPRRKHGLSIPVQGSTYFVDPALVVHDAIPSFRPCFSNPRQHHHQQHDYGLTLPITNPPQPTHHHRTPCASRLPSPPTRWRRPKVRLPIVVCRESSQRLYGPRVLLHTTRHVWSPATTLSA